MRDLTPQQFRASLERNQWRITAFGYSDQSGVFEKSLYFGNIYITDRAGSYRFNRRATLNHLLYQRTKERKRQAMERKKNESSALFPAAKNQNQADQVPELQAAGRQAS